MQKVLPKKMKRIGEDSMSEKRVSLQELRQYTQDIYELNQRMKKLLESYTNTLHRFDSFVSKDPFLELLDASLLDIQQKFKRFEEYQRYCAHFADTYEAMEEKNSDLALFM